MIDVAVFLLYNTIVQAKKQKKYVPIVYKKYK